MTIEVFDKFSNFKNSDWNKISKNHNPCLSYDFINLAELTGCASEQTGWKPRHLALFDYKGNLRAGMLLYEKYHSWGEYIFDFAWAQAYQNHNLPYYPKLISCIPFTPISSNKIFTACPNDLTASIELIQYAVKLTNTAYSSLHIHFIGLKESLLLESQGLMTKMDCQFHWQNNNYLTFEDFLSTLKSKKRKKIKRERKKLCENNITFKWLKGSDVNKNQWNEIYDLISMTFYKKGSSPYFNYEFFVELSLSIPDKLLIITAEHNAKLIGASLFFVGNESLYGRYWGTDNNYDSLHFETCYYQGIEFCIKNKIKHFEPGTGGEHKISRGFTASKTRSAHYLKHPDFSTAVKRHLHIESQNIERYIQDVQKHSPYKTNNNRINRLV